MKFKSVLFSIVMAAFALVSCGGNSTKVETESEAAQAQPKAVVCYFSATGTTAKQAQRISDLIGAQLFEIKPEAPYTEADLDWRDKGSRSSVEMANRDSRPGIADTLAAMPEYDIVFVGYPNWWNTAPTIINTFIESYDLEGKTIVPFMTSGGSDIENSEKELAEAYPTLKFSKGLLMNDVTDEAIIEWVKPLGLAK